MQQYPTSWQTLRLLLTLVLYRQLNKIMVQLSASKTKIAGSKSRRPTVGKKITIGVFTVIMAVVYIFSSVLFTSGFIRLTNPIRLYQVTWDQLSDLKDKVEVTDPQFLVAAESIIANDPDFIDMSPPERAHDAKLFAECIVKQTAYENSFIGLFVPHACYPLDYQKLVNQGTLLALYWFVALFSMYFSSSFNIESTKIDTAFLLNLPTPSWVLLVGKIFEYALFNMAHWIIGFSFFTVCALASGHGWSSLLLAWLVLAPFIFMSSSLHLMLETLCLQYLSFKRAQDIQFVFGVLSFILFFTLINSIADSDKLWGITSLPWFNLPFAWPLKAVFTPGISGWLWMLSSSLFALIISLGCLYISVNTIKHGFIGRFATKQGQRGDALAATASNRTWRPLGLLGKDLLTISRNRLLLSMTFVLPLLMIVIYVMLFPNLITVAASNFRNTCALIFGVSSYLLIPSASSSLSMEGPAIWMLMSTPRLLLDLLRQKLLMWLVVALMYALTMLTVAFLFVPWDTANGIADATMVLVGIPIFSVIAFSMGAAGTDVQAANLQERQKSNGDANMALLLIAGLYTQAIYTTSVHARLLLLVLNLALAYAMWQRLEYRLPWILDPTVNPVRRVDLGDGVLAVILFMLAQPLFVLWLKTSFDLELDKSLVISFSITGVMVASIFLSLFWSRGMPNISESTGLWPKSRLWKATMQDSLMWGMGGGLFAAMIGVGYLLILNSLPAADITVDNMVSKSVVIPFYLLFILTVIAAPLAEEFIFRGLLFNGLRATLPSYWAVLASSAAFALLHPTLSVLPVFVMGCIAAIVYKRCEWLLAPVLTHAVYNLVMIFVV
ncbi:hypothetical protein TI04_01135 [Achromatium sp. WMS2]|nr:hypothetical protein TI04_01135 [Achromatium sp. WMS2]